MPLFPPDDPDEKPQGVNIRLPKGLWKKLDQIARAEGKSRNFVVEFFLRWAAEDYEAAKKSPKKHL